MSRIVWLVTGIAWAARSMLEFAHPNYYDPATVMDWGAVWLYSVALLLLAPSVLLIGQLAQSRPVMAAAAVTAVGAAVAGGANAIEDGFGVSAGGMLYVVGFLTAWLSLLPLAATLWRSRCLRLAGLSVALFFGIALFTVGGGLIVLAALGALAIAPGWFARPQATSSFLAAND